MSDWTWIPQYQLYYSSSQCLWAKVDERTGSWEYVSAGESSSNVNGGTGSRIGETNGDPNGQEVKKDQNRTESAKEEVVTSLEDVGWAVDIPGLDHDDTENTTTSRSSSSRPKAKTAIDSSAATYDPTPSSTNYLSAPSHSLHHQSPSPSSLPSAQTLRLLITSSSILPPSLGQSLVIIDASPDGIQIGRDKSYKPRLRLREMEVSKVHAGIYWTDKEDAGGVGGFYVVDHGESLYQKCVFDLMIVYACRMLKFYSKSI